ncbi:MAG: glycoside hydrolase family 2 protein [Alicyclobacillus herbarius]|nr:glycoside hydrolase family 2 protein [Alicyclobacillus herbarius]MCL6632880.1 glycoside hydrolase family 2 protein [Alicyclobacillus herbarius]
MKSVNGEEWLPAQVPGSVYLDLLRAGRIPDPFYRDNELRVFDVAKQDYVYEREFSVDERLMACDRVLLTCLGLDTLAEIEINGTPVARTDNMHRTYEFEIKSLLQVGQNRIRVVFRSALNYILDKNADDPLWGPEDSVEGFPHLRKGHYMFGWDWGPKIPDLGIWRDIYIRGYETGRIEDVRIDQHHRAGQVTLDVHVDVEVWQDAALDLVVEVTAPDGQVQSVRRVAGVGGLVTVEIENPKLWWPNGYGEQPLYDVQVRLEQGGQTRDERNLRIGLRTIRLVRESDAWGESFLFEVNGVRIFACGANYIPEDNLLSRRSLEKTRRLLEDCVAANFNFIRVWGGGLYPEDYFYDLCDELGLVVWQDFMFACGVYRLTPEFEANIRQEAIDNLRRLRHHASLGLLCGNNEMEVAWVEWQFPKSDDLRQDYLRMFEQVLADVARTEAPQVDYWPASPSSGGGFDNPNDENRGDVHYWDVWHGLKPFTEYRKFHFRFCSEFGFQSFPSLKTIETFTEPEDRNVFSYVMENHQKNGSANGKILYYLAENFRYPKDLAALAYTSQILQAEAIKYGVEHWRRHRGRCMGAIYWQLNDCWPVASWSSIDYYGRWKALHYFAKRFFDPILISACEEGSQVGLWVTNDRLQQVSGTVRWRVLDERSRVLRAGDETITVAALSAEKVVDLDLSDFFADMDTRRRTYLEYTLETVEGVRQGTLLFVPAKHFEFANPHLSVAVEDLGDAFAVRVSAEAYAKYVALDLVGADAVFSDNFFDLSADAPRTVTVAKSSLSQPLSLAEFSKSLQVTSLYDTYDHE